MSHRITIAYLVTSSPKVGGLGYCCEWAFFHALRARRAQLMAEGLGVSVTALWKRRALYNAGDLACQGCPGKCMKDKLTHHERAYPT